MLICLRYSQLLQLQLGFTTYRGDNFPPGFAADKSGFAPVQAPATGSHNGVRTPSTYSGLTTVKFHEPT